jgi:hypothetical protein
MKLKQRAASPLLVSMAFLFLTPAAARAQEGCAGSQDLTDCLNVRVKKVVGAKIQQRSSTKQTETPSVSENSTSLVDESSAPDLLSVATNLAGLSASSDGEDDEVNTVAVTATAYSLYAAFKGFDPLNPYYYNKHRDWRRLSLTLGYSDENKPDGSEGTQRVKLFGLKYLVINGRDPNRQKFQRGGGPLEAVFNALTTSTTSFNRLINGTRAFVFKHPEVIANIVEPEFGTFLMRREAEVDAGVAAARRVVAAAESSAAAAPRSESSSDDMRNARAVADAVRTAATAEVSPGSATVVRGDVTEVFQAVERAAGETPTNAGKVASTARAALTVIEERARATGERIASLKPREVGTLFIIDSSFAAQTGSRAWSREESEYYAEFVRTYSAGAGFVRLRGAIEREMLDEVDRLIESELESFVGLEDVSLKAINEIRKAPQLSVAYFTKRRRVGEDEHTGEVIFDWGVADRFNLTANGGFEYRDSRIVGGDRRGGRFAAQLKYQVNRDSLEDLLRDRKPIYFDLAAEGKWMNGEDATVKGQAKLTIPVGDSGLELPLSLTVANRTELVDEKEIRGQFGFTFDFSRLVKGLLPNAPK